MKTSKRIAVLLLALVMLLPNFALAKESDDIISSKWVTIKGEDFSSDELNGIKAYPNRQCNELAIRYYEEIYGVDMFVGVNSPYLMKNSRKIHNADVADMGDIPDYLSGFRHAETPKVGDIVYWSMARRGKSYAHTALVKSYSNGVITLIEQNWNSNGKAVFERKIKWPSNNYVVYTLPEEELHPVEKPIAYQTSSFALIDYQLAFLNTFALRDENGNDTNYMRLREVAYLLNGSNAQFDVDYDGVSKSIVINTFTPYTHPNGTETSDPFWGDQPYDPNPNSIIIDGKPAQLDAITLTDDLDGQHTYFKLRDLGRALGFNVSWSNDMGLIVIDTTSLYSDDD